MTCFASMPFQHEDIRLCMAKVALNSNPVMAAYWLAVGIVKGLRAIVLSVPSMCKFLRRFTWHMFGEIHSDARALGPTYEGLYSGTWEHPRCSRSLVA